MFLFLVNWQFNEKLSSPLFPLSYNLIKYKPKRTSKTPISELFKSVGKNLEVQLRLIFKKSNFSFFSWTEKKLKSPARKTFKNHKISLWIRKNLEVQFKIKTKKSQLRVYGWIGKSCPNLNFTIENKMGNLYKIKLFKFQK